MTRMVGVDPIVRPTTEELWRRGLLSREGEEQQKVSSEEEGSDEESVTGAERLRGSGATDSHSSEDL